MTGRQQRHRLQMIAACVGVGLLLGLLVAVGASAVVIVVACLASCVVLLVVGRFEPGRAATPLLLHLAAAGLVAVGYVCGLPFQRLVSQVMQTESVALVQVLGIIVLAPVAWLELFVLRGLIRQESRAFLLDGKRFPFFSLGFALAIVVGALVGG